MASIKQFRRRAATITTADATPTVICSIDVEPLTVGQFAFRITGKNVTTGEMLYSGYKEGTFARGAATLTQPVTAQSVLEWVNSLLGTILGGVGTSVAISGGTLQVKVTGKSATSVQWRCNLWVFPN